MKTKLKTAARTPQNDVDHFGRNAETLKSAVETPQNDANKLRQECRSSYQFLEKKQHVNIWGTNLPHWHQDGKTQFVTFRLADSIPQSKDALLFYDGKRYIIHCYVIMPNHVHVLLTPIGNRTVTNVFSKVKGFSAYSINKVLDRKGTIWQPGIFDRIVRNIDNFLQYIVYIQHNPQHLNPDEYTLGGAAFLPQYKLD